MKSTILVVVGVQSYPNPALSKIYSDIREHFNVEILGRDINIKSFEFENYRSFSVLERLYNKLRLYKFIHLFLFFLSKNQREFLNYKFTIYLNKIGFYFLRKQNYDFIINIDSIGAYISNTLNKNVKNALFIYEILGFQNLISHKNMTDYLCSIENRVVQDCSLLISSGNEELGKLMNKMYGTQKEIVSYSICPDKQFHGEVTLNDPMKFYYHGALFPNRGLEASIEAVKDIKNAELYIRGFGPLKEELALLIKKLNITNVFLMDPVKMDQLTIESTNFDIGLSLVRMNVMNHQYNVGFKTFENISAGLALILPESIPLKILIEEAHNGTYYKDATVTELKAVFTYCIENKEKVKIWKNNTRKIYHDCYNPIIQKQILLNSIFKFLKKDEETSFR